MLKKSNRKYISCAKFYDTMGWGVLEEGLWLWTGRWWGQVLRARWVGVLMWVPAWQPEECAWGVRRTHGAAEAGALHSRSLGPAVTLDAGCHFTLSLRPLLPDQLLTTLQGLAPTPAWELSRASLPRITTVIVTRRTADVHWVLPMCQYLCWAFHMNYFFSSHDVWNGQHSILQVGEVACLKQGPRITFIC